tara:strand:- start:833 stop:1294 length:462 start_codon:yes stop_codon:yes gene_type:complete
MNILSKEFEKLKEDLIKAYDQKGMRASGDWANSLEVVQENEFNVKLIGLNYSQQLETGRKAGKQPPLSNIKKWIEDKKILSKIKKEISLNSLAFLIARKIAKKGWNRKGYGGVNLISDVITPERIQKIIDEIGALQTVLFTDQIIKDIQKITA